MHLLLLHLQTFLTKVLVAMKIDFENLLTWSRGSLFLTLRFSFDSNFSRQRGKRSRGSKPIRGKLLFSCLLCVFFFLVSKVAFWNSNRFDEIINQKRLLLTKISGLSTT